mmetsp:Transcript_5224/g.18633  ORF Transcript_5224/g.18633 Transcript_5224/m.18633 type:complete len:215 (-) Transcript_5224:2212-2856(-)
MHVQSTRRNSIYRNPIDLAKLVARVYHQTIRQPLGVLQLVDGNDWEGRLLVEVEADGPFDVPGRHRRSCRLLDDASRSDGVTGAQVFKLQHQGLVDALQAKDFFLHVVSFGPVLSCWGGLVLLEPQIQVVEGVPRLPLVLHQLCPGLLQVLCNRNKGRLKTVVVDLEGLGLVRGAAYMFQLVSQDLVCPLQLRVGALEVLNLVQVDVVRHALVR